MHDRLYEAGIEPEVRSWLAGLSDHDLWLAPGRRVILMTVFRKTRGTETAEVARALRAQMICETQHSQAHQVFDREVN
jgi:hypothetical protein